MPKIRGKNKRQNADAVCKLVLQGTEPTEKLLCCEGNSSCIINPDSSCSAANKLIQCWNIRELDACKRIDSVAQVVCSHKNGVYCLRGKEYTGLFNYGDKE